MKPAARIKGRQARRSSKPKASRQKVHFEFTNPAARKVCLAGTFNQWDPEASAMIPLGNGKWAKDLELAPGTYEYRLVVDGHWITDPNADHVIMNPFGERNSLLAVTAD